MCCAPHLCRLGGARNRLWGTWLLRPMLNNTLITRIPVLGQILDLALPSPHTKQPSVVVPCRPPPHGQPHQINTKPHQRYQKCLRYFRRRRCPRWRFSRHNVGVTNTAEAANKCTDDGTGCLFTSGRKERGLRGHANPHQPHNNQSRCSSRGYAGVEKD